LEINYERKENIEDGKNPDEIKTREAIK